MLNLNEQGLYFNWNLFGIGDTDFINNQGQGTGAFAFMNTSYPGTVSSLSTLMFITGSGNVGIGTVTPAARMEVNGNAMIDGTLSVPQVSFADGTSISSAAFTNPLGLTQGTVSTITQTNGNIGIGTGSPSAKLTLFGGALGATAGNSVPLLSLQSVVGNASSLNVTELRNAAGNNWETSTTRIQKMIDITNEGYMDFNPAGGLYGIAFGSGSNEIVRMLPSGNVGIGTTNPGATLEVNGNTRIDGSLYVAQGINFPASTSEGLGTVTAGVWNGSPIAAAYLPGNVAYIAAGQTGNVPVFTGSSTLGASNISTSGSTVSVTGEVVSTGPGAGFRVLGQAGDDVNGSPWYGVGQGTLNLSTGQQNAVQVAGYYGLDFETSQGTMVIRGDSGYIGLNTDSPGEMLEVNGNIKLTSGTGTHMQFADGTIQSTAWNGTTLGGDYAESVDVVGERQQFEPGDVMSINEEVTGRFNKSATAYSKLVAGVYSAKPGLVGRRTTADRPDKADEVPMAMMGIVPTKVSTENGAIARGDLLVTSSTPGYAMKGTDHDRLMGAVIGKALAPLSSGSGVIEVLILLQ